MSVAVMGWGLALCGPALARQASPRPGPEPLCAVSTDPDYGFSLTQPVQVGGGAMYAAARERRYLDALRGPKGDAVRYTRSGSTMPPGVEDPVDVYSVTYDGLVAPLTLFFDAYHFSEPKAPRGFLCARAVSSGPPPPDARRAVEQLDALAAVIAAAPGFRAGPVDLGGDPPLGLLVDAFRVKSRRARAATSAAAAGATTDTATARTTVVAFPQTCEGRLVSPSAIALVGDDGAVVEASATETAMARVRAWFPGQNVPAGSIAAAFGPDALQLRLQVRVSFADPTCAATATRASALEYVPAQLVEAPMPVRPANDASGVASVTVEAVIDHQGVFQQVRALGGPPALAQLAEATVRGWKAQPPRASGAPIAAPITLQVTFTAPR